MDAENSGRSIKMVDKNVDLKVFFKKGELIPAIIQDKDNGEILMLAYMNEESLKLTLETGLTWFWSRSRRGYAPCESRTNRSCMPYWKSQLFLQNSL